MSMFPPLFVEVSYYYVPIAADVVGRVCRADYCYYDQNVIHNVCLRRHRTTTTWLLYTDLDEYVSIIKGAPGYGAVQHRALATYLATLDKHTVWELGLRATISCPLVTHPQFIQEEAEAYQQTLYYQATHARALGTVQNTPAAGWK